MRLLPIAHPAGVGVLAGLLAGWAGGSLARAQPPESPAVVLPQQRVEVVRIEVVVAEKRGPPARRT